MEFSFGDREKCENTIRKTWDAFRDDLKNGVFKYNEIDKAKQSTFLKVYSDLFQDHNGIASLTKKLNDLANCVLVRGAVLKKNENPDYERFIPKKEYIKAGNRFSPAGEEWLYLATGNRLDEAVLCSKKECRVKPGDRFGYCRFEVNDVQENCKLVDLTIANGYEYDELNKAMDEYFNQTAAKAASVGIKTLGSWKSARELYDQDEFLRVFTEWVIYTYSKLFSNEIFVPLVTEDKDIEYAPFQTMAQYYISLGYSGIIYNSTVSSKGKNIVLFDKTMASPFGDIKTE